MCNYSKLNMYLNIKSIINKKNSHFKSLIEVHKRTTGSSFQNINDEVGKKEIDDKYETLN